MELFQGKYALRFNIPMPVPKYSGKTTSITCLITTWPVVTLICLVHCCVSLEGKSISINSNGLGWKAVIWLNWIAHCIVICSSSVPHAWYECRWLGLLCQDADVTEIETALLSENNLENHKVNWLFLVPYDSRWIKVTTFMQWWKIISCPVTSSTMGFFTVKRLNL